MAAELKINFRKMRSDDQKEDNFFLSIYYLH
jgi:hypothetical protein